MKTDPRKKKLRSTARQQQAVAADLRADSARRGSKQALLRIKRDAAELARRARTAAKQRKNSPHTGADDCPCESCAHARKREQYSTEPEVMKKRLRRARRRLPRLPKKKRGKKLFAPVHVPVKPFSKLRRGMRLTLLPSAEHGWERESAKLLSSAVELDEGRGGSSRPVVNVKVRKRAGAPDGVLRVSVEQVEGFQYVPALAANGGVAARPKRKPVAAVNADPDVYAVFRDTNGIAYLRVCYTKHGAQFIVNKGFSVELVELDANSTFSHMLAMRPVAGASIVECAKRLLQPLNDNVTISHRAKEHLESILENKELQMKATAATTQPVRPAKFAQVTAPAARSGARNSGPKAVASAKTAKPAAPAKAAKAAPAKAAKAAKAAPAKAAKAASNGVGTSNDALTVHTKLKANPLREGTFCYAQVDAIMRSAGKTVAAAQAALDKSGLNPNKRRLEVAWLQKKGYASFK